MWTHQFELSSFHWGFLHLLIFWFYPSYLTLTHGLLLIDLMSRMHAVFLRPASLPMLTQCEVVRFTMWGFISSAWTALTLVVRFHYWAEVKDPSGVSLPSSDSLSVCTHRPCAVNQHAAANEHAATFAAA